MKGQITKLITRMHYVKVHDTFYKCNTRGILRKQNVRPLVGDFVDITLDPHDDELATIDSVYERKNELKRPRIANVSTVVFVFAASEPMPNFDLLDRLLIQAEVAALKAIICLNKSDLDSDGSIRSYLESKYKHSPYKLLFTSMFNPLSIGELKADLSQGINVLAGPSGVGKSTLINSIKPSADMETGGISEKLRRGKHTTRHSELVEVESGVLLCDTPGFSGYESEHISPIEVQKYMPDIGAYGEECKFSDCIHVGEPGCAVKLALDEGKVNAARYASYLKILQEANERERNR